LEARGNRTIVATGLAAATLFGVTSQAQARPKIYVVPPSTIQQLAGSAGLGLYVPGAGGTVSRAGAIASLERGKVQSALLGGEPKGKVLADVVFGKPPPGTEPAALVELPPPGSHHNVKRYWVAFVGNGYRGILTSEATRIRGLVAVADIAPSLVDLEQGRTPSIRSSPDRDVVADLQALDTRLTRVHNDRGWTLVTVVLTIVFLALVLPRAAVLAGAAAVTASLLLSWAGATRFWVVIPAMAGLTTLLAVAAAAHRRYVPGIVALFLAAFTVVLAADPELNSLAVLGARPDGGGRFYGIGNQVETVLLVPVLAAAAIGGVRWLLALTVLSIVTIGWSKAGADGGGILVYATALGVLGLRLRGLALTPRRVLVLAAGVVALGFAFVGLDALLGGSSHVTHAVGTGPGSLLGDLGHRLHLSWESATKAWYTVLLFLLSVAALVVMGLLRPRRPTVDALLAGLVVSLLVNDTPVDVIGLGAIGCLALIRFESVDSRRMRRGALSAAFALSVLALAGCGSEGVTQPLPNTVIGTVQQAAPGKAIFLSQGCGACHTYGPAGPAANGKIGPDLDKLPQYAKVAKQPLDPFVHESIVDPDKYIQPGYPKGVMPKSYKSLPPNDIRALVDFLTKPQG
jgi:mono/diheme cytochrome c family protein